MFRRLQWKLTLSYALVTAAAIVLMQFLLIAYSAYFSGSYAELLALNMRERLNQSDIVPLLDTSQRANREALRTWLNETDSDNVEKTSDLATQLPVGEVVFTALVDADGRVILSSPPDATIPGSLLELQVEPPTDELLQAALNTESDASFGVREELEQLSGRGADGTLIAAVPILDNSRQIQGAWVTITDLTTPRSVQELAVFMVEVLPQVAQFALIFAVIVGALFGFLAARGLTRRLGRLVGVVDSWSEGDFAVAARDTSADELGQLAQRLNHMAEELKTLLQVRQELATVEERNRLARDLHDSVKQQLFATGMQVGAARALLAVDASRADERLADAERLAHAAQQELTMIIHELRPAALESKGLAAALRDYVADWSRHSGIAADISYQGERELPLVLEQALFRVAQEALANVARHSGATHVDVRVVWSPEGVLLRVSDNGQGFNPESQTRRGVGLKSMHERLDTLGGTLTVSSAPGHGTTVSAQIVTDGVSKAEATPEPDPEEHATIPGTQ
jgi:NarL family two-component system sensor histidine kinase LiaS